jgi:hypothetical protein
MQHHHNGTFTITSSQKPMKNREVNPPRSTMSSSTRPTGRLWSIIFFWNFQDIIFTPSREDMNTQKWFRDQPDPLPPPLKAWYLLGPRWGGAQVNEPYGGISIKTQKSEYEKIRISNVWSIEKCATPKRYAGVCSLFCSIFPSVGGGPQDSPKFQTPCLTLKSVLTCWIYSPDGDCKVSLKKNDPFMPNGRPIVVHPVVTNDWLMTESW